VVLQDAVQREMRAQSDRLTNGSLFFKPNATVNLTLITELPKEVANDKSAGWIARRAPIRSFAHGAPTQSARTVIATATS
jgi:hypothetical protein